MKALITGVCGQDGWYLSEYLLSRNYEVVGTRRGNEEPGDAPVGVQVVFGDVSDALCMRSLAEQHRPDEIYNLAAQSHVRTSFDMPLCVSHPALSLFRIHTSPQLHRAVRRRRGAELP